jgi:hypothetical protein
LAATLVAFTCAVARTVVWAATANILTKKGVGVLRDGGCRNGPGPDLLCFVFDGTPFSKCFAGSRYANRALPLVAASRRNCHANKAILQRARSP